LTKETIKIKAEKICRLEQAGKTVSIFCKDGLLLQKCVCSCNTEAFSLLKELNRSWSKFLNAKSTKL